MIIWKTLITQFSDDTTHYQIEENRQIISHQQFIQLLKMDVDLQTYFSEILKHSPYPAYFWEVKPVTTTLLGQAFEFVLVDSPSLAGIRAEEEPFSEYFQTDSNTGETPLVVDFLNLGKTSYLIAPTPNGDDESCPHLAQFVRTAPQEQINAFWQRVAENYEAVIGQNPKWLSTSGLGVYWLHVRIDKRPKYYQHRPYKRF